MKPAEWTYLLEITNESGEVIISNEHSTELEAHQEFEQLEMVRSPFTYKSLVMNLSEWDSAGTIGTVRVVVVIKFRDSEERYVRREMYRKA